MPPISVMIKPSSGMCNMICDYCFYCDETKKREQEIFGFMSEETLKNVIRRTMLNAEGSISYAFQGGEPTLRGLGFLRKFVELEKKYNKNQLIVSNVFQTNGILLDDEWCSFFHDNHFLVGVSLDGTEETHNAHRRMKVAKDNSLETHSRVIRAIDLLKKHEVEFNILTVVNQTVAKNIQSVYEFYRRNGLGFQQYIACLDPLDEVRGQNAYAIHPVEYGHFLISLFELWYRDYKKNRQPYIRQFENYIGNLMGNYPEACDMRGSCSVQYVVEADGGVYPCDFYMLDEYRLGNFNSDKLTVIDQKREESRFVERSKKLPEECMKCEYLRLCRGGCMRHREQQTANGKYYNYYCTSFKMFFEACLPAMREIVVNNSGKGRSYK
ncbi:anaerobic sulfatase maturase [Diplocloster agilis]|uniref:anaerobic sulfatase maturase n=1 Tax=Diplocloster agilis TaxID=2850323 RepID=UPI000821D0CB|nr:anaerobic sulfatase maturase [Suonthocola fibrivorans]MCU6735124.1 anaerobic sulfatase maturase [Suonthocola fibrivorans]SCJ64768.1 Anaerobic sulfatase-maturating enzyme [uncultured Clostridium sp.]